MSFNKFANRLPKSKLKINNKMMIYLILMISLFSLSNLVSAKLFTITNCNISLICAALEDQVNSKLPAVTNADSLAQGMTDASVISMKGGGADYASNMSIVALGGGLGLGAALGSGQGFSDLLSGKTSGLPGIGVSSGILLGLNLGFLQSSFLKDTKLFVNFGSLTPPSKFGIGGKFSTFGFHLQYDFVPSTNLGFGLLGFGGVQITTGFESSSSTLILSTDFSQTSSSTKMSGTAVFETKTSSYSIPLEISVNGSFLYLFTIYGGLGLDYNWGSTSVDTRLDNGVLSGGGISGTPNLSLTGNAKPKSLTFRNFVGLQFNILAAKLSFQLNNGMGNGQVGFVFAGKIVW